MKTRAYHAHSNKHYFLDDLFTKKLATLINSNKQFGIQIIMRSAVNNDYMK